MMVRITGTEMPTPITTRQPPPVIMRPILRSRPLRVNGMPIDLEIRDLAAEIPTNRFHEKPPRFTRLLLSRIESVATQDRLGGLLRPAPVVCNCERNDS